MPFEVKGKPRRVAIVGAGISGMAAAYLLSSDHTVVLFEAGPNLGGHAHTVIAGRNRNQPVDMGFIVFNRVNYPNLTRLFSDLNIPTQNADMGFGASIQGGSLEYALRNLNTIFAQRRNLVNSSYLRLLRDILKFQSKAEENLRPGMNIRQLIQSLGLSEAFQDWFLLPFSGAIWSTPCKDILEFPAETMIRFFINHNLMRTSGHHQWETVQGGSVVYVDRLQHELDRRGVQIRKKTPVVSVRRTPTGIELRCTGSEIETFDAIVLACHSDQALTILEDADHEERRALAAIRYQPNEVVLHSDSSVMPHNRRAWAAWTYVEPKGPRTDRLPFTYWMNPLQSIPTSDPLFVTLNPVRTIPEETIYEVQTFYHPLFDRTALEAQQRLKIRNGRSNTWFCGAWLGNGFHEDGFLAALNVAEAMR